MTFTGRLSRDGKVLTDLVTGEINEQPPGATLRWRGTIRYPASAVGALSDALPVRLDCDDGFAIEINLFSSNPKNKSEWVDAIFTGDGPPIA
jgi:hypothetical protein